MTGVYVLHFDRPVADHAAHYIGWAKDVDQRIEAHRQGNGARLVAAAKERGIGFEVAAVFPFKTPKAAREHGLLPGAGGLAESSAAVDTTSEGSDTGRTRRSKGPDADQTTRG